MAQNYKQNLPPNLELIWDALGKINWWKVINTYQKIKRLIAVFKAIASYATPEQKQQLETIYADVLLQAAKDKLD